jgi:acetate kinase
VTIPAVRPRTLPPAGAPSWSILALNAGASTVKFAVYGAAMSQPPLLCGVLARVGSARMTLTWHTATGESSQAPLELAPAPESSGDVLLGWLQKRPELRTVEAIGHRVSHGLSRHEPALVTPDVLDELRRAAPYAADQAPREIALIEACRARHPRLPQVVCFDTAFHDGMPAVARLLPIPRRYQVKGLRRYGFHGLSYAYLLEELARVAGPKAARGRVILAHLGNGASLAAVRSGVSIDTSMGFTPSAGLMMGTRTGDLDPGVASFLAGAEHMTARRFQEMSSVESGLLGVSETSADMRNLLAAEGDDVRAEEAVALFCYQIKKWVGGLAAALGGLDTLVFSAGIGEGSAVVRARVCDRLSFLGLELDDARNAAHAAFISAPGSRVTVRVMVTNEELMVARLASASLSPYFLSRVSRS